MAPEETHIICPSCGTRYRINREYIHKSVKCPRCESRFVPSKLEASPQSSQNLDCTKIRIACPSCQTKYRINREHMGRAVKCRHCGSIFKSEVEPSAASTVTPAGRIATDVTPTNLRHGRSTAGSEHISQYHPPSSNVTGSLKGQTGSTESTTQLPVTDLSKEAKGRKAGRNGSAKARRISTLVLILVGVIATLLISGSVVLLYSKLIPRYPKPVRQAKELLVKQEFQEAYSVLCHYINECTLELLKAQMEGGPKEERKLWTSNNFMHPEAFFIKGQIELLHYHEFKYTEDSFFSEGTGQVRRTWKGVFPRQVRDSAEESFDRAIERSSIYKDKVSSFLKNTLSEITAKGLDAEMLTEIVITECRKSIKERDYIGLNHAFHQAGAGIRDSRVQDVEYIVELLDDIDTRASQQVMNDIAAFRETASVELTPKQIEHIHRIVSVRIIPDLTTSLENLTEADYKPYKEHLPDTGDFMAQLFQMEPLPEGAHELYRQLVRCYMMQRRLEPSPPRNMIRVWNWWMLVDPVIRHGESLLPPLLEAANENISLAAHMLMYTVGRELPANVRLPAGGDRHFDMESSQRIWAAMRTKFVAVVLEHAYRRSGESYGQFCIHCWPGHNILENKQSNTMEEVAARLVKHAPALLEDDDFLFAVAWHNVSYASGLNMGERMAEDMMGWKKPHRRCSLSYYLQRFPRGRHAAMAKKFSNK